MNSAQSETGGLGTSATASHLESAEDVMVRDRQGLEEQFNVGVSIALSEIDLARAGIDREVLLVISHILSKSILERPTSPQALHIFAPLAFSKELEKSNLRLIKIRDNRIIEEEANIARG
ncbi:N-acetylglucosaminidase [Pseudozyma hubeiensis SY62]|uniref:N-acetylglucosaminidase n=1 Tax=Pseudozyma hubeiensis (strain SY62) TaxID=1305764 RepID=R9PIX0_PSEHS|nr:N-acetylglucosaminidase [Pseudozyma hubeiensis SY62]GAC98065.1 N-acetylglucosaminidase [Pseudozyma hubeiensis SY62]